MISTSQSQFLILQYILQLELQRYALSGTLQSMNGKLSIVATPIGNLEDITYRAVTTLTNADYILCEDTRVTGKLLKRYNITTPMRRYDAHTTEKMHAEILHDLDEGKHLAIVSDAGTPGVSDPGVLLVERARAAGIQIEAIPGPSAVTAAFSISGITGNQFAFWGFAPLKKGRQTFFKLIFQSEIPVIFFESTHRIMKALESLRSAADNSTVNCTIIVARELTKMHEELVRGNPEEILAYFNDHPDHQRGEFVVIVVPE